MKKKEGNIARERQNRERGRHTVNARSFWKREREKNMSTI